MTLDIEELETELKGSGYWKMNCSLLVDEEFVNSVTEMIPIWTAEGRKVLSDDRSTWDWIKCNIKHHAILLKKESERKRCGRKNSSKGTQQSKGGIRKKRKRF